MKIEITKDFRTLKKGQVINLDGTVANSLISRKVAKVYKPKAAPKKK